MTTSGTSSRYLEIYQRRRAELLQLVTEQKILVHSLGMSASANQGFDPATVLAGLADRIKSDQLRALIVGRFNAGKSTFINALFGKVVLPASLVPTTGVLCQISYADEAQKRAVIFPKEGMGENGNDEPVTIRIEDLTTELSKYVQIDHMGDSTATSRYEKCEIYWPLELCRLGVELTDSVGLDDPASRDAITLDFAQAADVILYCMKSHDVYSAKDHQVLSTLRALGHEAILFIITNYDAVRENATLGQTTEEDFKIIQQKNLSKWTEIKEGGIQYVDSKAALIGRTRGNAQSIAESGIEDVEEALGAFLAGEKGRAKLMASLRPLRAINLETARLIPTQIQFWQTSTEELEKRYRLAEVPLRLLESTKESMVALLASDLKDVTRTARRLADIFFSELPEKLEQLANTYEIQSSLGLLPRKATIEPAVTEVVDYLRTEITKMVGEWNEKVLSQRLEQDLFEAQSKLEDKAREFLRNVDEVRVQIAVGSAINSEELAAQREPSVAARLLALGFAMATGDILAGAMGVVVGPKALLNTLIFQIVATIVLLVTQCFNPFVIIPLMLAAAAAGNFMTIFQLRRTIADKVGAEMATTLREKKTTMAAEVEEKVQTAMAKFRDALDAGLQAEINSVRTSVEVVLEEKRAGELNAESKIAEIKKLEAVNYNLGEQIFSLLEEAQGA